MIGGVYFISSVLKWGFRVTVDCGMCVSGEVYAAICVSIVVYPGIRMW